MHREEVHFAVSGTRCAAWFYRPGGSSPFPCVVMGHGLGATRAGRLDAVARRFAAAGLAALAFDYRHFGESDGTPRQLLVIDRQLQDWAAAIEFVRSHRDVDADRVGLWGTSFGGGHVITTASRDPRLAAAVAQVPFVDGLASARLATMRQTLRLAGAAMRDALGALVGSEPHRVPVAGAPGTVAIMTTPDAKLGYEQLFEGDAWDNSVAARIALRIPIYRPIRHAHRIRCPLLVLAAEQDAITPAGPAAEVARRAQRGEFVLLQAAGHFDLYRGALFEQAVEEQTAFLVRHLSGERLPNRGRFSTT